MSKITLELLANYENGGDPYVWEIPLHVHVHNRIEQFVYFNEIKDGAAPIAYLENQALDSRRNLHVVNRSYQIPGNAINKIYQLSSWDKVSSSSYSSMYKNILATHKTYVDENGKTQPLFWKHVLPADTTVAKLQVISLGERLPVESGYLFEVADGAIYTNYQNIFDQDTGAYKLYFVQSSTSAGATSHVLLNPEPTVSEGTWEDIDLDTGDWIEGKVVFSRSTGTSGTTFYFSEAHTYYIKPFETSLIQPRLPNGRLPTDPWYLRFSAGDLTAYVNSSARRYSVPEFELQNFAPSKPYIYSPYEHMSYVNERVLAANRGSLKIDPTNSLHMELFIYDVEGVLIRVLSTNTGLEATRYSTTDVFYETDKILSWDEYSGKVSLGIKLLPSWTIKARYYYEADDYQYSGIDLNPLSNKSIRNKTVVFYIVPNVDDEDHAIHHLVVDMAGMIVECSQGAGYVHPNLQLLTPVGTYNSNTVIGKPYISETGDDSFVSLYTAGAANTYGYSVLAEVSFVEKNFPENQIVYDVRRPGAVISPSRFEDVIQANPKILQSLLGYGEFGEEVPRNGVVVLKPPLTLLSDYGGELTEEGVKALITQHLDSAVYPIIQYQYPVSELDVDSTVVEELTLTWTWEGPDQTYELLRRESPAGQWEVIDTQVSPARGVLTYNDVGLTADAVYYYTVRITEDGITFPNGNSVAAKVRA
jgi:hypothetical protein